MLPRMCLPSRCIETALQATIYFVNDLGQEVQNSDILINCVFILTKQNLGSCKGSNFGGWLHQNHAVAT
jgi:hypothetical protein